MNIFRNILGIVCGIIIYVSVFIPLSYRLSIPFSKPTYVSVNPDGTLEKSFKSIDLQMIMFSLACGLSGFFMSLIIMPISKNKHIKNVLIASIIIVFHLNHDLFCIDFNKRQTPSSKNMETEFYQYIQSEFNPKIEADKIRREFWLKQMQTEAILSSASLFVFALFGAWLIKKKNYLKKQKTDNETIEIATTPKGSRNDN